MRDTKMDNIKSFLIFCVIFGHMLELVEMGGLYRIIYSFHMPAFIFISGYFAKFNSKKIVMTLIYPYFLFQPLYIIFDALMSKKKIVSSNFQFTTPYWLLWYLLVMIFYYLLLPFIESICHHSILFVSVCVLAIVAGFDQTIGYYLSLSRFIVFLPYFVFGVIVSRCDSQRLLDKPVLRIINVVVVLGSCCILNKPELFRVHALYGSYSYVAAEYSFLIRIFLLFVGFNWIYLFLSCFPKQKIPVLSSIGQNTMQLFLVHGFVRKYIEYRGGVFIYSRYGNFGLAVLISFVIMLIFGNKYVGGVLRLICTGKGIALLCQKVHKLRLQQQE